MTGSTFVNGRKFDRVSRWDDRNSAYLVRSVTPKPAVTPSAKLYRREVWLDQGQEGACTGYSEAQALSLAPHTHSDIPASFAEWIYHQAKVYDNIPGEDYEGSSVLGAATGLEYGGYIKSYLWCTTAEEIVTALLQHGAVVLGLNWYESMFTPDPVSDVLSVSGSIAGGHAICIGGYKNDGDLFRLDNSWGRSWGRNGSAWLGAADLTRLLSEDGEACVPLKNNPLPAYQSAVNAQ